MRDRLVSHRTRLGNQIRDELEGTWIGDASGSKIPPLRWNKFSQRGNGLFTGELAGWTPNLAQPTAEGMMFTAYYLRRAVGRANFIKGRARIRTGLTTRWTGRSDRRNAGPEL